MNLNLHPTLDMSMSLSLPLHELCQSKSPTDLQPDRMVADRGGWLQDMRIDFQFDQAAFDIKFLPFKIPYPVPFKLLGDETKVRLRLRHPTAIVAIAVSYQAEKPQHVLQPEHEEMCGTAVTPAS